MIGTCRDHLRRSQDSPAINRLSKAFTAGEHQEIVFKTPIPPLMYVEGLLVDESVERPRSTPSRIRLSRICAEVIASVRC